MGNVARISSDLFEHWLEENEGQKHLEGGFYSNARLQSIARIERNESLASLVENTRRSHPAVQIFAPSLHPAFATLPQLRLLTEHSAGCAEPVSRCACGR